MDIAYPRLAGQVHLQHPDANQRAGMVPSRAYLAIDRGLKGGKLDTLYLSEDQLVELIASAADALLVLRRSNAR